MIKYVEKEELYFLLFKLDSSVFRSVMVEVSVSFFINLGKIVLDYGKFYKYEFICIEWIKYFENYYFDEVYMVKGFFKIFYCIYK